ncbi:hypothetical protein [Streptomyces sp. NPDC093109]|uniref:hypothetical protein n=1 Tax=Streptomyces sp. NPDC093109 TaxID=3154977 RepID=UPI00344B84A1
MTGHTDASGQTAGRKAGHKAEHTAGHTEGHTAEPRKRRITLRHAAGLCGLLLGGVLLLGAGAGLVGVRGTVDDERAFRAAEPCPAAARAGADCLRELPASVERTVTRDNGRAGTTYRLRLTGPDVPHEVDLPGAGPFLKRLHPGDGVTVTMWRDYATTVAKDGHIQHTTDTPEGEPEFMTALSLALLAFGAYACYVGVVLVRRPSRSTGGAPLPALLVPLGAFSVAAALLTIPTVLVGDVTNPLVQALSWPVFLLPAGWLLRRLHRGSRARHGT